MKLGTLDIQTIKNQFHKLYFLFHFDNSKKLELVDLGLCEGVNHPFSYETNTYIARRLSWSTSLASLDLVINFVKAIEKNTCRFCCILG